MPLLKGKENIGHNIEEMEKAGHPAAQAKAAALREAGVPKGDAQVPLVTTPSAGMPPMGSERGSQGSQSANGAWGGRTV
jgi:hypothetical protein